MSKEALESVIDEIREFLSAQQENDIEIKSKEGLINAVKKQKSFFLINLRYPRTLTLELLEDIASILIDNPTTPSSVVLELAQSIVYVAKELSSVNIEESDTSRLMLFFYDMMIPLKVDLIGTLSLLMNKIDGNDYTVLQQDSEGEIMVSFPSIDAYLRGGDISKSYKKYNNLVGRIGINSSPEVNIPSGVVSIVGSDKTVYASHTFVPIRYNDVLIPTIGKLDDSISQKIKGLIQHANILNPQFLLSLFQLDLSSSYQIEDINVKSITMNNAHQVKFLEPCKHLTDIRLLSLNDFEAAYIYHDSYQAYCLVCGERIPSFDESVNVLDKSFGRNLTVFVNYKLFEALPYRNYAAIISYVIEKNNMIEETLKLNVSDSLLTVSKTMIDILIYHNSKSSMLAKQFSEEIKTRQVFFPRLTNQLFIQEVYEKEKFAEVKSLNVKVLYLLCLMVFRSNFLIMLLMKFQRSSFQELFVKFLKRTKIVKDDDIPAVIWLFDFYQQDKLMPDDLQKAVKSFQNNCKLLTSIPIEEIQSSEEVIHLDDPPKDINPPINRLSINNTTTFFKPISPIKYPSLSYDLPKERKIERLAPQVSVTEARKIVERLKGDIKFSYFYDANIVVGYSIKSSKELVINSTNINRIINPYTDSKFSVEGNKVYDYLLAREPLPTFDQVNADRIESFILLLKIILAKNNFNPSMIDIESLATNINSVDDMMVLAVLVWSCFGYRID